MSGHGLGRLGHVVSDEGQARVVKLSNESRPTSQPSWPVEAGSRCLASRPSKRARVAVTGTSIALLASCPIRAGILQNFQIHATVAGQLQDCALFLFCRSVECHDNSLRPDDGRFVTSGATNTAGQCIKE